MYNLIPKLGLIPNKYLNGKQIMGIPDYEFPGVGRFRGTSLNFPLHIPGCKYWPDWK